MQSFSWIGQILTYAQKSCIFTNNFAICLITWMFLRCIIQCLIYHIFITKSVKGKNWANIPKRLYILQELQNRHQVLVLRTINEHEPQTKSFVGMWLLTSCSWPLQCSVVEERMWWVIWNASCNSFDGERYKNIVSFLWFKGLMQTKKNHFKDTISSKLKNTDSGHFVALSVDLFCKAFSERCQHLYFLCCAL